MRIASFDFRPALVPTLVFAVLFALLTGLGLWQLDRAGQKQRVLEARSERAADSRLDLNDALRLDPNVRYRPAVAQGHYRNEHWLLDNRVLRGQPGYHVFSLFELEGPRARALLVNRGWVPTGGFRDLLPSVAAPEGRVTVRGRLDRPASVALELESADLGGLAPVKVVQHLDIPELAAAIGRELLPLALVLDPDQPGLFERDWAENPGITPEKHLGYAVQWFALALALLIIYFGVNTRRADVTDRDGQDRGRR